LAGWVLIGWKGGRLHWLVAARSNEAGLRGRGEPTPGVITTTGTIAVLAGRKKLNCWSSTNGIKMSRFNVSVAVSKNDGRRFKSERACRE